MRFAKVLVLLLACGTNAESNDAGLDASFDVKDVTTRVCGNTPWPMYGHDARRTSASDGCIVAPFTLAWRYVPPPPGDAGKQVLHVDRTVATADALYVAWSVTGIPFGDSQALDRVTLDGKHVWTFVPGFGDAAGGEWPSASLGGVLYESDGLYWIDQTTGVPSHTYSVDYWGDVTADSTQAYVANSWFVDGPGLFVGAYDKDGKSLWTQNSYGKSRSADFDSIAAIAVDGDTVFFAANYTFGVTPAPIESGVYAFDRVTGAVKWSQPSKPLSAISVGNGKIYLVEQSGVVARKESDGSIVWTAPAAPPNALGRTGNAPALSGDLVLTMAQGGFTAFHQADGSVAWIAGISVTPWMRPDAFYAIAEGSGTVVLLPGGDLILILSLEDGASLWSGNVPGGVGKPKDPIIVGHRLYLMDFGKSGTDPGAVIALDSP